MARIRFAYILLASAVFGAPLLLYQKVQAQSQGCPNKQRRTCDCPSTYPSCGVPTAQGTCSGTGSVIANDFWDCGYVAGSNTDCVTGTIAQGGNPVCYTSYMCVAADLPGGGIFCTTDQSQKQEYRRIRKIDQACPPVDPQ